jgi:hypothetical protein
LYDYLAVERVAEAAGDRAVGVVVDVLAKGAAVDLLALLDGGTCSAEAFEVAIEVAVPYFVVASFPNPAVSAELPIQAVHDAFAGAPLGSFDAQCGVGLRFDGRARQELGALWATEGREVVPGGGVRRESAEAEQPQD